jgi:hypothetical protein
VSSPSGTVTFLFTDIEGSTRLWQRDEGVREERRTVLVAAEDEINWAELELLHNEMRSLECDALQAAVLMLKAQSPSTAWIKLVMVRRLLHWWNQDAAKRPRATVSSWQFDSRAA